MIEVTLNNDIRNTIVCTTTGELLMPVRLYYKIHNKHLLIKILSKLKSVEFEQGGKSFIISYYKEAKNLGLEVHYQEVPAELYPITLAQGYIKQGSILHIDLKSLKRATGVIDFLHKAIPSSIIEITGLASVNKLTTITDQSLEDVMEQDYNKLFDENTISHVDSFDPSDMKEVYEDEQTYNTEEKWSRFESYIKTRELEAYPEVEKISIDYSRKNHEYLITRLTVRSVIKEAMAMEHHNGNKNYSSMDVIKELVTMLTNNMRQDLSDELEHLKQSKQSLPQWNK